MGVKFPVQAVISAVDKISGPVRKISRVLNNKLGRSLKSVAGKALNVTKRLAGVGLKVAALGSAAALGGLAKLVSSHAEAGDTIAKFSRQIGVSVESLQEMQFAFDRQGVSGDAFNKIMETFNKRLGEARAGTGSLQTFMGKTNTSLLHMVKNAGSTEAAFDLLVDQLSKTGNESDRVALATAAFGRSGSLMAVAAEDGTHRIRELRQEARDLGLVMSTKAAQDAEAFTDSMTNLKGVVKGVAVSVGSELLPRLRPMIDELVDWAKSNRKLIAQKISKLVLGLSKAIGKIDLGAMIDSLSLAVDFLGDLAKHLPNVGRALVVFGALFKAVGLAMAASPAGAIIATLAGAAVLLMASWEPVRRFFSDLWTAIGMMFGDAWTAISGAVGPMLSWVGDLLEPAWAPLTSFFQGLWDGVTSIFEGARDFILGIVDEVSRAASKVASSVDVFGILDDEGPRVKGDVGGDPRLREAFARLGSGAGAPGVPAVSAAGGAGNFSGKIVVEIPNAPAGTKARAESSAPGVAVVAKVGRRFGGD